MEEEYSYNNMPQNESQGGNMAPEEKKKNFSKILQIKILILRILL